MVESQFVFQEQVFRSIILIKYPLSAESGSEDLQRYYANGRSARESLTLCFSNGDGQSDSGTERALNSQVSQTGSIGARRHREIGRTGTSGHPRQRNPPPCVVLPGFEGPPEQAERSPPRVSSTSRSIPRSGQDIVPSRVSTQSHRAKVHCDRTSPGHCKAAYSGVLESESQAARRLLPAEDLIGDAPDLEAMRAALQAVEGNSLVEVIAQLESGKIKTHHRLSCKNFLEEALAKTKGGVGDKRIRKVLNIYKHAANAISVAQNLNSLHTFQFEVLKVTGCEPAQERAGLDVFFGSFVVLIDKQVAKKKAPTATATHRPDTDQEPFKSIRDHSKSDAFPNIREVTLKMLQQVCCATVVDTSWPCFLMRHKTP